MPTFTYTFSICTVVLIFLVMSYLNHNPEQPNEMLNCNLLISLKLKMHMYYVPYGQKI